MKAGLAIFLLLFSLTALATDQTCDQLRAVAVASAYNDTEFRAYICPNEEGCSTDNFGTRVDARVVNLEYGSSKLGCCEFFVVPKLKGKQFPTLVFVGDGVTVRPVLSDYENGLSIAKSGKGGMLNLVSQAHPGPDQLVRTTYSWDGKKYITLNSKCFKVVAKKGGRSTVLMPKICE